MILVTGGTGFIGQALIRHLIESGHSVRTLIRPSKQSPNLPHGVNVDVTVSSLSDARGLRAAMVGVDTVYHLISGEWRGPQENLMKVDISGTQNVLQAATDAHVDRFFYISHLGADRASAYPVLKAKAITEEYIRRSGLDYTIIRSAIVFGQHDGFTSGLAMLLNGLPFVFLVPGEAQTLLQPLWIEDLVTCLSWALDEPDTRNRVIEIGGPEFIPFQRIIELVMDAAGIKRRLVHLSTPYMRGLAITLETFLPGLPVSQYWLDYLSANRTCALDSLPRVFHLMPSRFSYRLAYLTGVNWKGMFWRSLFRRRHK
jgi:uncharacterized protein YbjT (DUF2867 family)